MGSATSNLQENNTSKKEEQRSNPETPAEDKRTEMNASANRLKAQIAKKDGEIEKLTRDVKTATAENNDLKKKMLSMRTQLNKKNGRENQSPNEELKQLKTRIADLEGIIKKQDLEIDDLRKKLLQIRRDKDNQVEIVKETVEKVIGEKESEIRRLKAISGLRNSTEKLAEDEETNRGSRLLAGRNNGNAKARFGISAENRVSKELSIKNFPKTEVERKNIARALRRNIFLSSLAQSQVGELIECMKKEEYGADFNIIKEGDTGTHLYVIAEGEVEVFQSKPSEHYHLAVLRPGCVFGELAILYNCKRTASVRAKTNIVLWSLDRASFQSIVQRRGKMIRDEYTKLLQSVDQLRHLPEEKIMRIADCLEEEYFKSDDYIIRQGETGDTFYIIYDGKVKVTKYEERAQAGDAATFLCYMDRGNFFGERALLREERRAANVIAYSDVICLTLDRLAFISLIGSITETQLSAENQDQKDEKTPATNKAKNKVPSTILEAEEESQAESGDENSAANKGFTGSLSKRDRFVISSTKLESLKKVKLLGKGGFGLVSLVQIPQLEGHAFALKAIRKSFIVKMRQEQHVIAERNILMSINSAFIARLHRTFKDKSSIYMLMDAYLGGDIYYTLKRNGAMRNESARFCTACVVEALSYLHIRNIAYRDLKPENLMIDQNGYVKLVDFGFAKKVKPGNKTWTFCGTPEYFPPEILQNLGHDVSADYWSLGILSFELLTTTTPFYAADDMTVYQKIVDGIERVKFPPIIAKSAELLIRNLCRLDPKSRLGYKSGGVGEIRKHRWFRGFYWEGLRQQAVVSPFQVKLSGPDDVSNFELVPVEQEITSGNDDTTQYDDSSWDIHF